MRERYFPNFFSTFASASSRTSEFCSHKAWKCRPEIPASSFSFFLNSEIVTPMREPFAHGLYRSLSAPDDSGLMRMPHSILLLFFLLCFSIVPLYFFHKLNELKIMWSEYCRCSLMSCDVYAGANVCTSLPNFSLPKRASFTELAHTPSRYFLMRGNVFHTEYPFNARRTVQPDLSLTFFNIFRFSSNTPSWMTYAGVWIFE